MKLIFPTIENFKSIFSEYQLIDYNKLWFMPLLNHAIEGEDRLSYATLTWIVEGIREIIFEEIKKEIPDFSCITKTINAEFFLPNYTHSKVMVEIELPTYSEKLAKFRFSFYQDSLMTCNFEITFVNYDEVNKCSKVSDVWSRVKLLLNSRVGLEPF